MTGSQIAYYNLCHRKLWLFIHNIDMEQNSDIVSMGRFISETTYKKEDHEVHISDGEDEIVLDYFDSATHTIHEVKKSDKMEETHIWQVKFYISVLEKKGIEGVTAIINYPKLRQTEKVILTDDDRNILQEIRRDIQRIGEEEYPPDVINKPFCKNCSYYDLCYV